LTKLSDILSILSGDVRFRLESDIVLAIAILEVFWCCCLAQMKENRQAYHSGTTDSFRQILIDAPDTGRRYGPIEQIRRTSEF
jgi:hypothetical protein